MSAKRVLWSRQLAFHLEGGWWGGPVLLSAYFWHLSLRFCFFALIIQANNCKKFIKNKQQLINLNFRQTSAVSRDQFVPYWIVKDFLSLSDIFTEAINDLDDCVSHWCYIASKEDYFKALCEADVVVPTAKHELFGVTMWVTLVCPCACHIFYIWL